MTGYSWFLRQLLLFLLRTPDMIFIVSVSGLGIATVDASKDSSVSVFVQVLQGGAFRTYRSIPAVRPRMPKPPASKAAHGVWDAGAKVHPSVAHHYCREDICGVECQHNAVSRSGAAPSPCGDPPGHRWIIAKVGVGVGRSGVGAEVHIFMREGGPTSVTADNVHGIFTILKCNFFVVSVAKYI